MSIVVADNLRVALFCVIIVRAAEQRDITLFVARRHVRRYQTETSIARNAVRRYLEENVSRLDRIRPLKNSHLTLKNLMPTTIPLPQRRRNWKLNSGELWKWAMMPLKYSTAQISRPVAMDLDFNQIQKIHTQGIP